MSHDLFGRRPILRSSNANPEDVGGLSGRALARFAFKKRRRLRKRRFRRPQPIGGRTVLRPLPIGPIKRIPL